MSDRKRQQYSPTFKAEAVRFALEGERSIAAVARDLGVRADLIRKWKQEHLAQGLVPAPVRDLPPEERVRQLERELAVVRQERDFLKKATAFFARASP